MPNQLNDDDLRAIASQLGPQYAVLHCPTITLPWYSSDDTAAIRYDVNTTDIRVATAGPLTRETRMELAIALAATVLDDAELTTRKAGE